MQAGTGRGRRAEAIRRRYRKVSRGQKGQAGRHMHAGRVRRRHADARRETGSRKQTDTIYADEDACRCRQRLMQAETVKQLVRQGGRQRQQRQTG